MFSKIKIMLLITGIVFTLVGCSGNDNAADQNSSNSVTKEEVAKINESLTNMQTQIDIINETINDFVETYGSSTGNLSENRTEEGSNASIVPSTSPASNIDVNVTDNPNATDSPTVTNESSKSLSQIVLPDDFSEYKKQAETIKSEVSKNKDTKMSKYHDFRAAINDLEQQLDLFDDKLEEDLRNETITLNEYKKVNKEINQVEEILDEAENLLERQFGIND